MTNRSLMVRRTLTCVAISSCWLSTPAYAQPAEAPGERAPERVEPAPVAPPSEAPPAAAAAPAAPVPSAPAPAVAEPVTEPEAGPPEKKKKDKGKKAERAGEEASVDGTAAGDKATDGKAEKDKSPLQLKGRIMARAELASREVEIFDADAVRRRRDLESLELFLPSARAGFEYKTPIKGVRAVMTAEFTGRVKLKDAYVQARNDFLGARVGQFKPPGAPIETESRLSLPTVDRGFIHDLLTERLEVGERRPGVSAFVYSRYGIQPKFTLAVFQGSYLADEATRETEFYGPETTGAQTLVARAEAMPLPGLEVGLYGTNRVGTNELPTPDEAPDRFWAGGADVRVEAFFGPGALRFWVDGTLGESWFRQQDKVDLDRPLFVTLRSIAAYRFGGIEKGDIYVEPYGSIGVLDPDSDVTSDMAWEAAVGVNVGFWERGKLSLQGTNQGFQRNFPAMYEVDDLRRRNVLALQVGVSL